MVSLTFWDSYIILFINKLSQKNYGQFKSYYSILI